MEYKVEHKKWYKRFVIEVWGNFFFTSEINRTYLKRGRPNMHSMQILGTTNVFFLAKQI